MRRNLRRCFRCHLSLFPRIIYARSVFRDGSREIIVISITSFTRTAHAIIDEYIYSYLATNQGKCLLLPPLYHQTSNCSINNASLLTIKFHHASCLYFMPYKLQLPAIPPRNVILQTLVRGSDVTAALGSREH